jgi:hypothetical protein
MATTKSDKIAFIIKHSGGNADPDSIAAYYHKQSEAVVDEAYQRLLQGEKQKIVDANSQLQTDRAAAQAQIASQLWRRVPCKRGSEQGHDLWLGSR